jgi:hypothetical protein
MSKPSFLALRPNLFLYAVAPRFSKCEIATRIACRPAKNARTLLPFHLLNHLLAVHFACNHSGVVPSAQLLAEYTPLGVLGGRHPARLFLRDLIVEGLV